MGCAGDRFIAEHVALMICWAEPEPEDLRAHRGGRVKCLRAGV